MYYSSLESIWSLSISSILPCKTLVGWNVNHFLAYYRHSYDMMIHNLTTALSRTDMLDDNGMMAIWNYLHYVFLARGLVHYLTICSIQAHQGDALMCFLFVFFK